MAKRGSAIPKDSVTIVPTGISGSKQENPERIHVDYEAVARAMENSDLNSQEETGNVTGLHLRDCTILVQKLAGSKYRGPDAFGWLVWIKPKPKV
jgi:hypothetical protein